MEEVKKRKSYQFINILKAVAIIMVIILHNHTPYTQNNIFFVFCIGMAVPIFMLITGFNYTNSALIRPFICVKDYIKTFVHRYVRLTLPFMVILLIEWFFNIRNIQHHHFTTAYINGGVGPGSYYYPVMLQIILIFPIIFYVLKKFGEKGLWSVFAFQLFIEYVQYFLNLNSFMYKQLCFRYLFFVALGSWLVLKKDKISTNKLLVSLMIGVSYLTIFVSSESPTAYLPFDKWSKTALLSAFYIFPIFAYIYYNYGDKRIDNRFTALLELIGRASWHIYLIQMLFFAAIRPIGHPLDKTIPLAICIPLSILICVTLGIIFYKSEKFILKVCKIKI